MTITAIFHDPKDPSMMMRLLGSTLSVCDRVVILSKRETVYHEKVVTIPEIDFNEVKGLVCFIQPHEALTSDVLATAIARGEGGTKIDLQGIHWCDVASHDDTITIGETNDHSHRFRE